MRNRFWPSQVIRYGYRQPGHDGRQALRAVADDPHPRWVTCRNGQPTSPSPVAERRCGARRAVTGSQRVASVRQEGGVWDPWGSPRCRGARLRPPTRPRGHAGGSMAMPLSA